MPIPRDVCTDDHPLRSGTNAFRAIRSMRPTTVTLMVIRGVLPPDTPERLQRAVT